MVSAACQLHPCQQLHHQGAALCCAGDVCVLGGGVQVVRRTEVSAGLCIAWGDSCCWVSAPLCAPPLQVRLACSPDRSFHFLVREPQFCSYIFVIYSPALCTVPEFHPIPIF
jgi:hypothetical protein